LEPEANPAVPVSLAFPLTARVMFVPVADLVSKRGDPAKTEQESPMFTTVAQLVLDEPGPTEVRL
jgi:hypothetical protein